MKRLFVFFLFSVNSMMFGQIIMTGNLADRINTFINNMPDADGDDYHLPGSANLATWSNIITDILQGNYSAAETLADPIGYQLLQYTDNSVTPNKLYYVLEKKSTSVNYWGIFIYNPVSKRPKLFIQSPHPKFDTNTGQQGFFIFQTTGARAHFITGAHRCNSSVYTSCDGTTDVCDTGTYYRISDQAHNVDGTLQKTTEIFNSNISGLIVIQNHGFGKISGDPDVIMGNGRSVDPSGTDFLVHVANNMLKLDSTLTFKIGHIDTDWTRLNGTTNVQGRLLNGNASPCTQNSATPNGRFLHIEQALTGLRDKQANWTKLANAIAMAVPISPTQSGNWEDTSIWPGAVLPDTLDYVLIPAAQTITVNSYSAKCFTLNFAASTSRIALGSGSVLNVYGDFTLFSITHNAFASWSPGAKLCFSGPFTQIIGGWDNALSTTTNTTLMEVQVNKSHDTVKTPGTDMKLSLGTSLEVIKGIFYLDTLDDINGKSFDGSTASAPTITIQSGGSFIMDGGASAFRTGSSGTNPLGKLTLNGYASLATTSSLGIGFQNIDVNNGGTLVLNSFSSSQPNNFNPGTLTVYSGGTLVTNSIINYWNSSAILNLQSGGTFKITTSTTNFPLTFTNNGTLEYSRNGDQTLYGKNYSGLTVSGTGNKSLTANTSVSSSLIFNGSYIVTGAYTLTLGTSVSTLGSLTSNTGWVIGTLKRWFANTTSVSKTFAIGTTGNYRPVSISFTTAPDVGGSITSSFVSGNPGTSGLPLNDEGTNIISVSPEGYWILTAGDGLSGGRYSLNLTPDGFSGISSMATLRILKRTTGNNWTLDGTHDVGTTVVKRTGMSGLGEFGIGGSSDNPLPVELTLFTASEINGSVFLKWVTATETANYGWEIERKPSGTNIWTKIGFAPGAGLSSSPKNYSYTDINSEPGSYDYRLKQIDQSGDISFSDIIKITLGNKLFSFRLEDNFPNPFNPSTTIRYSLPSASIVKLSVYNVLGSEVRILENGPKPAGNYSINLNGINLASGTYFYKIEAGKFVQIKKMNLIK